MCALLLLCIYSSRLIFIPVVLLSYLFITYFLCSWYRAPTISLYMTVKSYSILFYSVCHKEEIEMVPFQSKNCASALQLTCFRTRNFYFERKQFPFPVCSRLFTVSPQVRNELDSVCRKVYHSIQTVAIC